MQSYTPEQVENLLDDIAHAKVPCRIRAVVKKTIPKEVEVKLKKKKAVHVHKCLNCNEVKELTAENFNMMGLSRVSGKPYYRKICKYCVYQAYRAKNPDKGTKRGPKPYFSKHPDKKEEVLELLAAGNTPSEVANLLDIKVHIIRAALANGDLQVADD